jgi:hypothetical protein
LGTCASRNTMYKEGPIWALTCLWLCSTKIFKSGRTKRNPYQHSMVFFIWAQQGVQWYVHTCGVRSRLVLESVALG